MCKSNLLDKKVKLLGDDFHTSFWHNFITACVLVLLDFLLLQG